MTNRDTVQGAQGEFQPGSNDLVLANQLGITSVEEMNELELYLLQQLYEEVLLAQLPNRAVQVADLKTWHRRWLGNVYDWAGQERSVNMSKGGFMFAAAPQIPRLLADFERSCLARWTPCHGMDTDRDNIWRQSDVHSGLQGSRTISIFPTPDFCPASILSKYFEVI